MLYLVDGYNVTRTDPATSGLPLEAQRDALVARLAARGREILGAGRIVVVFDAQGGAGCSANASNGAVEVVFARTCSADDAIVAAAARATDRIVLVSSDRDLAERVRVHARGGLEVREREACFDAAGRGRARKGPRPAPRRDVGMPSGANRITEDLKKLWLTDEE